MALRGVKCFLTSQRKEEGSLPNHAELAPHLYAENERWYLSLFGVYQPRKLLTLTLSLAQRQQTGDHTCNIPHESTHIRQSATSFSSLV